MNQPTTIVGIDVSKASLAVCYQVADKLQHLEVSNSKAGFQQLIRRCGVACYVMEATGVYYLSLAYCLVEQLERLLQAFAGNGTDHGLVLQALQRIAHHCPLPDKLLHRLL